MAKIAINIATGSLQKEEIIVARKQNLYFKQTIETGSRQEQKHNNNLHKFSPAFKKNNNLFFWNSTLPRHISQILA